MRSLILGATGQIGAQLIEQCELQNHAVLGTWYRRPHAEHLPLDLCDDESVQSIVAEFQPDVIFLAAGMNQIDFAESHPSECQAVNVDGATNVLQAARRHNATLVYFSTAHVVGECPKAKRELDPIEPKSVHARSAAEMEARIRAELPDQHLILRTNWVFGPETRGKNPAAAALRRFRNGQSVASTAERQCQPTYSPDLARAAVNLVHKNCQGTFNIVGPDRMSEFAFYQNMAFVFGFDSDLVELRSVAELCEDAPRPRSVWLDRFKLRSELGAQCLRGLGDALRSMRDSMRDLERVPAILRAA